MRTSKTLDECFVHTYKYINGKVCYEEYEDKKLWFFYDADGNPSHLRYFHDETEYEDYYYGCNWRGDVVAIFDSEGNLAGTYDYDAWGNAIYFGDADGNYTDDSAHITLINPIRYRGYYCDTETGFYYLNSRYYDPYNHRFLNADSYVTTGQGLTSFNMFAYCGNNPVNRVDETGMFWSKVCNWASNSWNAVKSFVKKTFGSGSYVSYSKKTSYDTKNYGLVTRSLGTKTQTSISTGNLNKPLCVYSKIGAEHNGTSISGGLKLNTSALNSLELEVCIGLTSLQLSASLQNGSISKDVAISFDNLSGNLELEITDSVSWDSVSGANYVNYSVGVYKLAFAYITSKQLNNMYDIQPALRPAVN